MNEKKLINYAIFLHFYVTCNSNNTINNSFLCNAYATLLLNNRKEKKYLYISFRAVHFHYCNYVSSCSLHIVVIQRLS